MYYILYILCSTLEAVKQITIGDTIGNLAIFCYHEFEYIFTIYKNNHDAMQLTCTSDLKMVLDLEDGQSARKK